MTKKWNVAINYVHIIGNRMKRILSSIPAKIAEICRNNLRPKFSFHSQGKCQFEELERIVYDSFVCSSLKLLSIISRKRSHKKCFKIGTSEDIYMNYKSYI